MMVTLPLLLSTFLWLQALGQQGDVIQFHGSGSSVGSRCFWHILETMGEQTKVPIRGTYRSTGSGTGELEYIGNITVPFTDFGSSDFPLPKDEYETLQAAGQGTIHLPVVMGAIGVFHSVPMNTPAALNLTSCLVARIFQGDINDWTHPDIVAINPDMNLPVQLDFYGQPKADQSLPIKVAHRADSSGSTHTFTSYLHKACPDHWQEDLVDSSIEWPMAGSDTLYSVEGTSEIIDTLQGVSGVISYADAGAALEARLDEVALKIELSTLKEDFFLTISDSLSKDGIAAALEAQGTNIPDRGDADWSKVDLINQVEGYIYAWPMVAITYAYVRQDLTFIQDPRSQSLLVAFLKALYDPIYTKKCEEEYKFLPVTEKLRNVALQSIDMLELSPDAPEWIQETSVLPEVGQGDNVISIRRKKSSSIHLEVVESKMRDAELVLGEVLQSLESIQSSSDEMKAQLNRVVSGQFDEASAQLFEELDQRLDTTFIMSITSLAMGFVMLLFIIYQQRELRKLQARPPITLTKKKTSALSSTEAKD